ncbi:putative metalloprotease CJM1_0395 family protein [Minwuia sp.]|uniref:putative metalloprotease CJM1_0395 family protein n=1 Tax=Minwuia sp. TaxID=2493630 RepID=UPI003A8CE33D
MITALQTSTPIAQSAPAVAARPVREAERAPVPARPEEQQPGRRFIEQRGLTVAGSTLVAAQEEAGKPRQTTEEQPKPETGLSSDLSDADRDRVRELQARDREVRAHEQAHARVGGQYAGSPEYEFERGPDGRSYAVGGHVSISTSPVPGDPAATVRKMEVVKRAALAPSEPSGQDRSVAADAEAKRADARAELNSIRAEEQRARFSGEDDAGDATSGPEIAASTTGIDRTAGEAGPVGDPGSLPTDRTSPGQQDDRQTGFGPQASDTIGSGFGDRVGTDGVENSFGGLPGVSASFETAANAFGQSVERASGGLTGGIGGQDIAAATQAEALSPTRRTGIDIRV